MQAIEVSELGKTFLKWESRKHKSKGDGRPSADKSGETDSGPWLSRVLPHRAKVPALEAVSFTVARGEIFGVLGPNGSGKSTLIRVLSTLMLPDSGQVRIFGRDVVEDPYSVQRLINRVSVDAAFFKKLSAHENLMYTARLYGVPAGQAPEKAKAILRKLAFDVERYTDPLEDFSRGMQQKVAIARALLTSPVVLLLDEPTTGLDPKSKRDVQAFVKNVRETHDATVILTTHDMEEADRLCDRIAIIDKGRIIALDTSKGLKSLVLKDLNGDSGDRTVDEITLEDVFLHLTGAELKSEVDE